jgi:hypothetical protein
VVVGAGGHLRQVGDASTWRSRPAAHQAAHRLGHGAAHAGVHLVEDQRLRRAQLAGGDGNGQRNARQLAAGGHLAHRPRRAAGMACDQKADVFQPAWRWAAAQLFQRHFEAAALHAQALHGLGDGLGQQRRGLGALRETARGLRPGRLCGLLVRRPPARQVGCGVQRPALPPLASSAGSSAGVRL